MEAQTPVPNLHPYMRKGHSIKVDIVARQALVSPVFRKPSVPPIAERYVKVFDPVKNDLESQSDETYLLETKLYDKYKTIFNNISKDSLTRTSKANVVSSSPVSLYSTKESDNSPEEAESQLLNQQESAYRSTKRKKLISNGHYKSYFKFKSAESDELAFRPWMDFLPAIVKTLSSHAHNPNLTHFNTHRELQTKDNYGYERSDSLSTVLKSPDESLSDDMDLNSTSYASSKDDYVESATPVTYKSIRSLASALVSLVGEMDLWHVRVEDAVSRTGAARITLSEAQALFQEFKESTAALFTSELQLQLEREIVFSSDYSRQVREKLGCIFNESDKNAMDFYVVEKFLKAGLETRFVTPEYISLSQVFYNISSLRHLLDESVLLADMGKCSALIKECDDCSLKIPNLDKLKSHVARSLWLNHAYKYSQKPVNYTVVAELIDSTPDELRQHPLYYALNDKLQMALDWLESLNDPRLRTLMASESFKNGAGREKGQDKPKGPESQDRAPDELREDSSKDAPTETMQNEVDLSTDPALVKADPDTNAVKSEPKLKPEELEDLYNKYQKIELVIPTIKNIEPVYHMWRRFQRRHRRLESLLSTENTSNCTIESLVLLHHAEPLSEYIDISSFLEPIRKDVEVSLDFEKKCRPVLNRFNNWSITNECIKFRTDWNSLVNFRKNANVSKNDLVDVINIVYLYKDKAQNVELPKKTMQQGQESGSNEFPDKQHTHPASIHETPRPPKQSDSLLNSASASRVEFGEIEELRHHFQKLHIKNWQMFRNVQEIHNAALQLQERAKNVVSDLSEGVRTDDLVSNLILVTLETLKFGANLNLEDGLLVALKYCLWAKKLYGSLKKLHLFLNGKLDHATGKKNGDGRRPEKEKLDLSDPEDAEFEGGADYPKSFLKTVSKLVDEPASEGFENLLDSKHPLSKHLNIRSQSSAKPLDAWSASSRKVDRRERLVNSTQIFSLTEAELVSEFAP